METAEATRLIDRARTWFSRDEQIEHYVAESADGPSAFESMLLERLPAAPARVLDVGCGAGRIAVPLAAAGYQVTGVDVSEGLVEQARNLADDHGVAASFETVNPTELPFHDGAFDMLLSIKQYCYLPGAERRMQYLTELRRVLRPGGLLLLTGYLVPSEAEALAVLEQDEEHRRAVAEFDHLEPLDTFSAGDGYVHWFTRELLLAEVSSLGRPVEVVDSEDQLQVGLVVRI